MIHLPASVRVYLCLTACDMRRSFDGLHALVRDRLELDAFVGYLFVFANRRRDRCSRPIICLRRRSGSRSFAAKSRCAQYCAHPTHRRLTLCCQCRTLR